MDKEKALTDLRVELENADLPLKESNLVFGEGDPDCNVLFVGEAPGFHEDMQGRPFVGRAGQLLNKLINKIGWQREDVYITNIVKRRPPENRDPLTSEIESYKPYLARQIEIVNPKIIAPLGRFSTNYFLPFAKISQDQGKVFEVDSRKIVPLYHPAAALRSTSVLHELEKSFMRLPEMIAGNMQQKEKVESPVVRADTIPEKKTEPPPQSSLF